MASVSRIPYVSVEMYLSSGYLQPDMDYVDGVLEERHLGELEHASLQRFFDALFYTKRSGWSIDAYPELRVQVAPMRFRVPDLCVMAAGWRKTPIVQEPPLLCIEILSSEDTLSRQCQRAQDYLAMGVAEVWIFDPETRTAYVMRADEFNEHREGSLQLATTKIEISLEDVFAALDE